MYPWILPSSLAPLPSSHPLPWNPFSRSFGGWADIWFFQAHLGASVRFMSLDAGFTGELLPSIPGYQSGYGKEAVVQLHPISGYVRGTIYQVVILGDRV